ncbi:polysaccharide deacetylase family protein [Tengunoibacter tsumagoiensis]|uniref:NodB homology domain-containing protein n=1 Tax=Tengunoibacter tsumagoiensis TaxID=2014871 RepID=A0A402A0S3_9CHLR|nr:polysaccharide deacetylase family protein [Tengunoibacter tsumagoiensis]GCE12656.1 hypothetical protein KTT_25150 [Tengunoibacter tsumagoiensis]
MISSKKIPILMYHSISEHASKKFQSFAVAPALFTEQLEYLKQQNYTPMTVTQMIQARAQGGSMLPAKPVVLTFDDGFADFYTHAFPILQKYAFVATLYVTTAYVNGTSRWLRSEGEANRLMVTWDQLIEMSAWGIECGAHTHTHPQLDVISPARAREEIVQSKQILEQQLRKEVVSFAYPFGYQTAETRQIVQEAGYTSACAVKHKMSTLESDLFALERFKVDSQSHSDVFAALLVDRNLSAAMAMQKLYLRTRTPLWQCARRSTVSLAHMFFHGGRP